MKKLNFISHLEEELSIGQGVVVLDIAKIGHTLRRSISREKSQWEITSILFLYLHFLFKAIPRLT